MSSFRPVPAGAFVLPSFFALFHNVFSVSAVRPKQLPERMRFAVYLMVIPSPRALIWSPFGVHFGSHFGSTWGPFGVHFGFHLESIWDPFRFIVDNILEHGLPWVYTIR